MPAITNISTHVNNSREVSMDLTSTLVGSVAANIGAACSSVYCHSTGKPNAGILSAQLPTIYNGSHYSNVSWGDTLTCASCHGKTQTSGEVIFKFAAANPSFGGQIALPDVQDRHILILDDILDSGNTLAAIREKLETARPRSIKVCVLLSKKKQRARAVDADYLGFEIEDEFVVGYGLDYDERYRNLPCIGVLRRELMTAVTSDQ